jgi:hypothetical protein
VGSNVEPGISACAQNLTMSLFISGNFTYETVKDAHYKRPVSCFLRWRACGLRMDNHNKISLPLTFAPSFRDVTIVNEGRRKYFAEHPQAYGL